jgi:hypothetical protein
MMTNETEVVQIVRAHLPQGAELLTIDRPFPHPAVTTADLDGDGTPEIAAAYRLNSEAYVLMLQQHGNGWRSIAHVRGPGYAVSLLTAAPITSRDRSSLIVGWQIGAIWSKLSVYESTDQGLRDIAPFDMNYSYIEIEDMPGLIGKDGIDEIAMWIHDTGEAYRVEVVRWQNGEFSAAVDVYPYYFQKVANYYEVLTRKHPDYAFYWYYLADAQYKTGRFQAAAASLDQAFSLKPSYPSSEELLHLQELIRLQQAKAALETRTAELYPAVLKTTEGNKWGYINRRGEWVLRPQYEYAADFQDNGYAVVQINGHSGIIDPAGKYVVPPKFDSISPYSEGRAIVIDEQGFKVLDQDGRIITGTAYGYIAAYRDGRAVFTPVSGQVGEQRYGYLDLQGTEVIPARYENAADFQDDKAIVKLKEKEYALIRPDGKHIATYPYAFVGMPGEGLLPFQKEPDGKYGYINERGKVIISPQYANAQVFEEGRAIVNTAEDYGSLYGLIDRDANLVIKPEYNEIRSLGEQRWAIGKPIDPKQTYIGSKFAIVDINGKHLSEFLYNDVSEYRKGLASVSDNSQTYFIDRSGKAAPGYPRLNGSGALALTGPLIQANVDQRLSYLDRSGNVVWKQNTVIPLRPPYRVKEHKYKPNKDFLVYYPEVEGMSDRKAQRQVNDKLKKLSQVKSVPADIQLDYNYSGDFAVSFFQKNLLQLELNGYNFPYGAAHGMPSKLYTQINLINGHMYELKDLFKPGSDYVNVLSAIVGEQIKEDPQYSYVFPDTYTGIKPDQPFYVTNDALHLFFYPYEIAPYVAGFPTFTIPFSSIMNIIADNGELWRSFHSYHLLKE